jgi:hypothetical protein
VGLAWIERDHRCDPAAVVRWLFLATNSLAQRAARNFRDYSNGLIRFDPV